MFELIFLGTAAAVPSAERGLPALLVARGARRFLIDCGEGTQRQLVRGELGFRGLRHVLLTHAHLDHVLGLAGLLATLALFRVEGVVEYAETPKCHGLHLMQGPGYDQESTPGLVAAGATIVASGGAEQERR